MSRGFRGAESELSQIQTLIRRDQDLQQRTAQELRHREQLDKAELMAQAQQARFKEKEDIEQALRQARMREDQLRLADVRNATLTLVKLVQSKEQNFSLAVKKALSEVQRNASAQIQRAIDDNVKKEVDENVDRKIKITETNETIKVERLEDEEARSSEELKKQKEELLKQKTETKEVKDEVRDLKANRTEALEKMVDARMQKVLSASNLTAIESWVAQQGAMLKTLATVQGDRSTELEAKLKKLECLINNASLARVVVNNTIIKVLNNTTTNNRLINTTIISNNTESLLVLRAKPVLQVLRETVVSQANTIKELQSQLNKTAGHGGGGGGSMPGPPGAPGAPGATGARGEAGMPGKSGPAGATGVTGQAGKAGATGSAGADGKTKLTELTRAEINKAIGKRLEDNPLLKGDTGSTGATGLVGQPGKAGARGATGPAGSPGSPGSGTSGGRPPRPPKDETPPATRLQALIDPEDPLHVRFGALSWPMTGKADATGYLKRSGCGVEILDSTGAVVQRFAMDSESRATPRLQQSDVPAYQQATVTAQAGTAAGFGAKTVTSLYLGRKPFAFNKVWIDGKRRLHS
eukprot:g2522.t1